eukprot:2439544-Amphidinium_carterae.2
MGGGRHGAAARLALRRALRENPAHFPQFVDSVESQLRLAFSSRAARALSGEVPTMREHIEHRAQIGNHRPTISWAWILGGARDALAKKEEALAPFASFHYGRVQASPGGHSVLSDPQRETLYNRQLFR